MAKKRKNKPRPITTQSTLPCSKLSDEDFERLIFGLLECEQKFDTLEYYGGTGDGGRDIIGIKHESGRKKMWYFQVKKYQRFSYVHAKPEIEKLINNPTEGFIPDVLVFAVSCKITPNAKDRIIAHAKKVGIPNIEFLDEIKLDRRIKKYPKLEKEFFSADDAGEALEAIEKLSKKIDALNSSFTPIQKFSSPASISPTIDDEVLKSEDAINKRIDEVVALLNLEKYNDARNKLFVIFGEIKDSKLKKELFRVYNNLGITFNRPGADGNYDEAIHYFRKALELDPISEKAKINLASAYINKGTPEDTKIGLEMAKNLWASEKKPRVLNVLLCGIYSAQSSKDVLDFIEQQNQEVLSLIDSDIELLNFLSRVYTEQKNLEKAFLMTERALLISPQNPELMSNRARVLILRAQQNNVLPSDMDILPRFNDYKDIEDALILLSEARELAEKQNKKYLLMEIAYGVAICNSWLGEYQKAKNELNLLESEDLTSDTKFSVKVLQLATSLKNKDFEEAYKYVKETESLKGAISYGEKRRLIRIFMQHGAVEQAKLLAEELISSAEIEKDYFFWLDLSIINVFLEDKDGALYAVGQAKKYVQLDGVDPKDKRVVFSHYNALLLRYSKIMPNTENETERLLPSLIDYQKEFPEDKILTEVKALDENNELTDEAKEMLMKRKEWWEGIKNTFETEPIPTYCLENFLHKTYSELIINSGFKIEFTTPHPDFLHEIESHLKNSEILVFDYLSLLDISKLKLLGFLQYLDKKIYIHEELLAKIHEELLKDESDELRRLWSFLRKSKLVHYIEKSEKKLQSVEMEKMFDKWLTESLKFAKEEGTVLVTDDLRLMRYAKSEDIKSTNIIPIIKFWMSKGLIDDIKYARIIGDLAERYYTFLSFTGEQLFRIAMEDNLEIRPRTFHLVSQMFMPGSEIQSFAVVFIDFTIRLWQSGSLPEEKIKWLKFLTEQLTEYINQAKDVEEKKNCLRYLAVMWGEAIKKGTKDDLRELDKVLESIFTEPLTQQFITITRAGIKTKLNK